MCNHGLQITCRDGSWRSRSKVSPVYAKRLSFYNTCVQRQGQQPLHHSLSERDPPSRKLNPGPMFVQYFMCAAFRLLNTQWITLCLKSYLESRHDLILKQNFCMVYTSWLIYFSVIMPWETIVNTYSDYLSCKVFDVTFEFTVCVCECVWSW